MSELLTPTTPLTDIAKVLASCPAVWAPLAVHESDLRFHARLTAGPGWEAYLITWPSGHGVEVHDHGGSAGAVAVVAGSLVELVAKRAPSAASAAASPLGDARLVRHRLDTGTVRRIPTGRIHDVVNTGRLPATSIHVYGPALDTMTFYDDDLRPTRTERVFPETPLLTLDAVEEILRTEARTLPTRPSV